MREKLIHELEEERHLRLESEKRLREAALESQCSRAQMRNLQQQLFRMEETVRNLLQNQGPLEQKGVETINIMKVYQEKLPKEERKQKARMEDHNTPDEDSRNEGGPVEGEKEKTKLLLERLKTLEAENSALALENENQREQYERCLDEVANQVVQALLTQKDLREECLKLKTRVVDLEQQNQSLSVLFQQRVRPASDKLFQKLHSRILDLSSLDLLTEVERNRSLRQLKTDFQSRECQQHVKSGIPTIKCQSQLHVTGPSRLYPRSSCSSSELSLSSACSEYSSGSSCTWNDGKTCSKLQSSVSWDTRINIASSVPSNLSSPTEELPPTRIKECHILEGLKKLQSRKGLLEPPSLMSKWGYKDCMDSNEGIYSPGIKGSSHNEQSPCKPKEISCICSEHRKVFAYDSDSHDDADDESSTLALLHKIPSKDCRLHCNKLSHSISDNLFGWEPNGKHLLERGSYFNSEDRPEKLTSIVNDFQSEVKSCTSTKVPVLQLEQSLANMDFNLQLSDTDDNEVLDELHIESSDEKSPSDLLLTPFTGKHQQNTDMLVGMKISQFASSSREGNQGPTYSDINTKTCNFIKQQKVIKKTSSEECITIIFDAEDGEPIEFCSHQTGVVTVTRNEISLSQQPPSPNAEYTELLPHLVTKSQNESDSRKCNVFEKPEDGNESKAHNGIIENSTAVVSTTVSETVSPERTLIQSPQQQKLLTPPYTISCKTSQSISFVPAGGHHTQNLTKIPSKGTLVTQKSKSTDKGVTHTPPVSISVTSEKSPSSPPVKLSRFMKAHCPPCHLESKSDLNNPKHSINLSPGSKIPNRSDWTKEHNSNVSDSPFFPHTVIQPNDYGEPPTRDKHVEVVPQESRLQSPPPPPPGRSVSLLIRPHYVHSPPLSMKPVPNVPCEIVKTVQKLSPLKGTIHPVPFHNDKQQKRVPEVLKSDLVNLSTKAVVPGKSTSQQSNSSLSVCQGPSKAFTTKQSSRACHQPVRSNSQDISESGSRTSKAYSLTSTPLEVPSPQSTLASKKGKLHDSGVPQQHKFLCSSPTSTHCHSASVSEFSQSQVSSSQLASSSSCNAEINVLKNSHGKGLKTRLPVGLKVLVKSPQLLRKSCTVPGKQEKDSINAASKGGVTSGKSKQHTSTYTAANESTSVELETDKADVGTTININTEDKIEPTPPLSLENISPLADIGDGIESNFVKRSNSSTSKSHLKPALGMNGAKARSQSFSVHVGDQSSTPACEAPGKMRTHIITNTTDRGNSLTRQNSTVEGATSKTTTESSPNSSKVQVPPYSRQGSHVSMSCSGSQQGSPSKLPCRTLPQLDLLNSVAVCEGIKSPCQKDRQGIPDSGNICSNNFKHLQIEPSITQGRLDSASSHPSCSSGSKVQNADKLQSLTTLEEKIPHREVAPVKSTKVNSGAGVAIVQHTIEEKVMLGIQENVQKGQVQVRSPPTEPKQKTVPSIASWFGFRRSKLPSFSGRKPDTSKAKVEKKEVKSATGFGHKQVKVEKKKEKNKTDQQCDVENKCNKNTESSNILDRVLKGDKTAKSSQDIPGPMRCEQNTDTITTTCSAKDIFMKEILNRVDKKAAQQTESGSNNVSYRSVSKGSSQSSSLPSNSISIQGNHKKNSKTKADMEMQNETLTYVITETICSGGEDTIPDSGCQAPIIESSCLMRTLDSGIGTFPLPDSGNRATGRYLSKQESPIEREVCTPPEPLSAATVKARTLERELPSADSSQVPDESNISRSLSDPTMTAKCVQPFQSHLPRPSSSGIAMPDRQAKSEHTPIITPCLDHNEQSSETLVDHPEWSSIIAAQTQDRALRVRTYSASSSDTERELEYETNNFGTGGRKLLNIMKNNKQAEQEVNCGRTSFTGHPMSIMDLYEHNVYVQYKEDGPKHVPNYNFLQQLCGATSEDEMSKEISSKLKQADERKEESAGTLAQISLESLNKFNRNSLILLEKETNGLNKVEEHSEENGRDEEVSLSSSERPGVDNLESLSDSLYDSFSSCASQGSNDV